MKMHLLVLTNYTGLKVFIPVHQVKAFGSVSSPSGQHSSFVQVGDGDDSTYYVAETVEQILAQIQETN